MSQNDLVLSHSGIGAKGGREKKSGKREEMKGKRKEGKKRQEVLNEEVMLRKRSEKEMK